MKGLKGILTGAFVLLAVAGIMVYSGIVELDVPEFASAARAQTMAAPDQDIPPSWQREWPNTDFSLSEISFSEILSGGPPKDGIPSIDDPRFIPISSAKNLGPNEPIITLTVKGETRAYPLSVLTWHEIVNDTVAGVPVVVTYCPLCNAAIAFERTVQGRVLEFGTTGKLRSSDLVMYDRETQSWWQQFLGRAIVGSLTGTDLVMLPVRIESFERVLARTPDAMLLVPNNPNLRAYGSNPYVGYDTSARPFLYDGEFPENVEPMMRVIAVGDKAWTLELLRSRGRIEDGDLVLSWQAGQNSALDKRNISESRDVGNVVVQRKKMVNGNDVLADEVHHVTFAFVFHAFKPEGEIFK